ncbi:MAG TPA: acyl-CoA dehydrogenase family protein [Vicinamibacteria bacterium]|jgi:alkylation response protein AidB-like acyl-CoA dehydrogenase|nr:acyl-CoA dehydrogenase family protein [Vicinamibacteria bacterium]
MPHIYGVSTGPGGLVSAATKVAREIAAARAAEVDASARFPKETIEGLASAGLLGLTVSRELGGKGEGPRTFAAAVEEIAQACSSSAMVYVMHVSAVQAIAASATLADRDDVLREVAKGKHLTTLALSERGSRSQFWAPVSKLEPNGRGWVTSATKSWVTSAGHADSMVASAQRAGAESPLESTLYLARKGASGVKVTGRFDGLGLRGNDSAPVAIDKLSVKPTDLITEPGAGPKVILEVILPWFALGTAAMANGICRAAVGATAQHLMTTGFEHSGQALRDLPVLRARLARMSARTEQSRALLGYTLGEVERPSETTPLYVLQARLAAIEAAVDVTDLAMKACGGAAFSKHLPVERLFRDARAGWVMAPTVDHLEDFVGKALTGLPLF